MTFIHLLPNKEKIKLACLHVHGLKVKKVDSSKGISSKYYLNNLVSNKDL